MCDDAEDLAGAGTDVRRCSNALGPRKNLHGRAPHRRVSFESASTSFRSTSSLITASPFLVDLHAGFTKKEDYGGSRVADVIAGVRACGEGDKQQQNFACQAKREF